MRPPTGFDEVLIVNPHDPVRDQGVQHMQFSDYGYYAEPDLGYYAEPEFAYAEPELGWYGEPEFAYYAEDPYGEDPFGEAEPYGWYGEPEFAQFAEDPYGEVEPGYSYAEADPYGYYAEDPLVGGYAEDPYGYYAEDPTIGYYAEDPTMGAYGEVDPVGYYAEDPYGEVDPLGGYGQMPEMVGYGEPEFGDYAEEPFAEDPLGMYGEPDISGYVRDGAAAYNPGCPMPTNIAGYDEADPLGDSLGGYVKPPDVNPSCQFTAPPAGATAVPEMFKPLW